LPKKEGRYLISDGECIVQSQFLIPMKPANLDETEDRKPEFPCITTHWKPITLPEIALKGGGK